MQTFHDEDDQPLAPLRMTIKRQPSRAINLSRIFKAALPALALVGVASAATLTPSAPSTDSAATTALADITPQATVTFEKLAPVRPHLADEQLDISAPAWREDPRYAEVILNATTGEIVFDRNAQEARNIASMTKVMTIYLAFEAIEQGHISLDTTLTASAFATSRECSCYGLHDGRKMQAGDTMTLREALHALLSGSYNDVATMVGEALGGSEENFAAQMTSTAYRLGARNTTFGSASGLYGDDSTALDIAMIYSRLNQDYPALYNEFFTPAKVVVNGKERDNCRLCEGGKYDANASTLGYNVDMEASGQKTGYRRASGFSMVAEFDRAGQRYIVVTMGTPNNKQRHARASALAEAIVLGDDGSNTVASTATVSSARRPS